MSSHAHVVELSKKLQVLSLDLERKEKEVSRTKEELQQVMTSLNTEFTNGNGHSVPRQQQTRARIEAPTRRYKAGGKTLPQRIVEVLNGAPSKVFGSVEIADAIGLEKKKRSTLHTTLWQMSKDGRVKKNKDGYRTALGSDPVVRKASA